MFLYFMWLLGFKPKSPRVQREILPAKLQPQDILKIIANMYKAFWIFPLTKSYGHKFHCPSNRFTNFMCFFQSHWYNFNEWISNLFLTFVCFLGFEPKSIWPQPGILTTKLQSRYLNKYFTWLVTSMVLPQRLVFHNCMKSNLRVENQA